MTKLIRKNKNKNTSTGNNSDTKIIQSNKILKAPLKITGYTIK